MLKSFIKSKKFWIWFWGVCYFIASLVLIVEASMPGDVSSSQSNAVGGQIADIINDIGGDQSEIIDIESLKVINKQKDFNIGDEVYFDVSVYPSNTTFPTLTYSSSDTKIATVNEEGLIKFLSAGNVTITATSQYNTNLKASYDFVVHEIEATSISSIITLSTSSVETAKDENDAYILNVNKSYRVLTTFEPQNTTLTDLTYSFDIVDYSSYFSFSNNIIKVTGDSLNSIFTLTVTAQSGVNTLVKFKTTAIQDTSIPLESFSISGKNQLVIGQTVNLNTSKEYLRVSYNPTNATYKSFTVSSSDETIIKKSGKNSVKAMELGTATITIVSDYYPDVSLSFDVEVVEIPLTNFTPSVSGNKDSLIKNKSYSINIRTLVPSISSAAYNKTGYFETSSSDESVIKFKSLFNFDCVGIGNATITIKAKNTIYNETTNYIEKTIDVTVINPPEVIDFSVNINFADYSNTTCENTILTGKTYNLSNYIKFAGFESESSSYSVSDYNTELKFYTNKGIEIKELNVDKPQRIDLEIRSYPYKDDSTFYMSKQLTVVAIYDIEDVIFDESSYSVSSERISYAGYKIPVYQNMNLDVGDTKEVKFTSKANVSNRQIYYLSIYNDSTSINIDTFTTYSSFNVTANTNGVGYVLCIPVYDGVKHIQRAYAFKITTNHILIDDFNYTIINQNNDLTYIPESTFENQEKIDVFNDSENIITPNTSCLINISFPDKTPTSYQFKYETSDENVASLNNNIINFHKQGVVDITILDEVTSKHKKLRFYVFNIIEFQSTPFTIYDNENEKAKINENNVYQLTKGVSYKIILNFKDTTTFKDAAFASSNESGLFVGGDGTLSPLEEGDYTISITLDDGFSKDKKLEISTKVSNASVITDLSNFFLLIRKSVGHFGAFLVYGIASTFFFKMIFDKKNWLFAVVLNISQGFAIATLTEFIQLFVAGRSGTFNDVLIDFTGFICSSIFITLVFIGIEVFKYFKAKKEKVN